MKDILQSFCQASGQTPNWDKSGIIFSKHVRSEEANAIRQVFCVPLIDAAFKHLGHPLILPGKNRSEAYHFIIDKFRAKLSTYKANTLSHAARITLINSVFASIPVYYMSNIIFSKKFLAKLTSIIRNFWWTGVSGDQKSRALCLRAWKDICAPKKEGGLGIRNLQAVNQGLLLSAAWRIAKDPHGFLHNILKSKYFNDSSIWRPKPNLPKSAFWTSVLKVIPLLHRNSFYQITQGNISIWNTPWCEAWPRIYDDLILQEANFSYPAVVSDLWIPGQKLWNNDLIDSLFMQPTASIIKRTPIISLVDPDILCWKLTPNGQCTSKSAYRTCLQFLQDSGEPAPVQVQARTVQLLNQVWKNKLLAPRIQVFAWRLLRKAIPTGQRAARCSKHIASLCSRCGQTEDDTHLFFTCPFARAAWFLPPWYLRTDIFTANATSVSEIVFNITNLRHPQASLHNIFTFLWCLWKSRNEFLFCRKVGWPYQVNIAAQALLSKVDTSSTADLSSSHSSQSQENRPSQLQIHRADATLVPSGMAKTDTLFAGPKLYTDASWKQRARSANPQRKAGLGVYCHFKEQGYDIDIFILASAMEVSSALQAEAAALELAAHVASLLKLLEPTFLSDCLPLTHAAAAKSLTDGYVPWEIRKRVSDFKNLTAHLRPNIFHISREFNGVAHNCAQQAIRSIRSEPNLSCRNSAHRNSVCPTLTALANLSVSGIVTHVVYCF